jgi:Zn-dependent protease
VATSDILMSLLRFALLLPAIILHEIAHGYVAYLLGDPTAKDRGRLTLNPLAHIDLWGTILMPALLLFASGGAFAFGYAKPVPINPYLMRKVSMRNGLLLTGIAGPLTNIALAIVSAIVYRVLGVIPGMPDIVLLLFYYFAYINLVLAFFNLIPIPPMDGSRVVQRFLSGPALRFYTSLEQYGFMIILGVLWILPRFTGIDFIGWWLQYTTTPVARLLLGG